MHGRVWPLFENRQNLFRRPDRKLTGKTEQWALNFRNILSAKLFSKGEVDIKRKIFEENFQFLNNNIYAGNYFKGLGAMWTNPTW